MRNTWAIRDPNTKIQRAEIERDSKTDSESTNEYSVSAETERDSITDEQRYERVQERRRNRARLDNGRTRYTKNEYKEYETRKKQSKNAKY